MYRDAASGLYDSIVLVSNDSDAEPALQAIREDFPLIMIGLIVPMHPLRQGLKTHRRASGSLAKQAHWTISHITDAQLT